MSSTVTLLGTASGDTGLTIADVALAEGDYLLVASMSGGAEDDPEPFWGGTALEPLDCSNTYNHTCLVRLYGPVSVAGTNDLAVTNDGDVPHGAAIALKLSGFEASAFDCARYSYGGILGLSAGEAGSSTPAAAGETAIQIVFVDGPTSDGSLTFGDGFTALGSAGTAGDGDPTADVTIAAGVHSGCSSDEQEIDFTLATPRGFSAWFGLFKAVAPTVTTVRAYDGTDIASIPEPSPDEVSAGPPPAYPLFAERVNGAEPVEEVYRFLTDVRTSRNHTEQRIAARAVPVRELHFRVTQPDQDAADRLISQLWVMGLDVIWVPLWHESRPLLVSIPASTSSYVVYFDAGAVDLYQNYVMLWAGPEQWEELLAIDNSSTGITAATKPLKSYTAGVTAVVPIGAARLIEAVKVAYPKSDAVDVLVGFRLENVG